MRINVSVLITAKKVLKSTTSMSKTMYKGMWDTAEQELRLT